MVYFKFKIWKVVQYGVCLVFKGSEFMFEKVFVYYFVVIFIVKFCIQEIEKFGGFKEVIIMLYMLMLLKDLLFCFLEGLVKSCSEIFFRVMILSYVLVIVCVMQVFYSFFYVRFGLSILLVEFNVQIIMVLYDYVFSENDL